MGEVFWSETCKSKITGENIEEKSVILNQTLMVLLFRLLGLLNEGERSYGRALIGVKPARAKLQVRNLRKKVLF